MRNRLRTQRSISEARRQEAAGWLLFGVLLLLPLLATQSASGQTYKVLYRFTDRNDGGTPEASLLRDAEGNLYGTTYQGGAFNYGAVFKLDPNGKETTLRGFAGVDGMGSSSNLVRDDAGNLYGTTQQGGTPEGGGCWHGCGTVFKVDTAGKETVLHAFTAGADGGLPYAGLARDSDGNLYGTTFFGGDLSACQGFGCGTVFKVDTAGKETVLYAFTGGADGGYPQAGVIRDAEGNLYGATRGDGDFSACRGGCGVVFKVDTAGNETVLYSFTGGADGAGPNEVIRDSAGNLYGTTVQGGILRNCGSGSGCGTVFKLDPNGKETVLYSFTGAADGRYPSAGLTRDRAGNLYGVTAGGGNFRSLCQLDGCGVVFKVDRAGKETVVHTFTDGAPSSGISPPGVILDKGNLYGVFPDTGRACEYGCGLVFKITLAGSPLVF